MNSPANPETAKGQRSFLNKALPFMLAENFAKPLEPVLVLVCAGLYAGGEWGVFKFYESLIFLFFRLNTLGIDKGIIWFYSQVDEQTYRRNIFKALNLCFVFVGATLLLTFSSYAGYLPFRQFIFGNSYSEFMISYQLFLVYFMCIPLMVISEILVQANINKQILKYRIWVHSIVIPLTTYGLGILGYFVFPKALSLPLCLLIGNLAGCIVAIFGFFRSHRPSASDFTFSLLPSAPLLKYSIPLASANLFSAFSVRIDVFMLAGITGVKSLEIYNIVSMIGKSLTSIRTSFEGILLSVLSSSSGRFITEKVKELFNYSIWIVMNIQLVIFLFAILFGRHMLALIHPQYAFGYSTLLITSFFICINTFADFSTILTMAVGQTMAVPAIQVVFFLANLGLNILLIPHYDSFGAAAALGMANLLAGILYMSLLIFYSKKNLFIFKYWRITLINSALVIFAAGAASFMGINWAVKVPIFLATSTLIYIIQRKYFRFFNMEIDSH